MGNAGDGAAPLGRDTAPHEQGDVRRRPGLCDTSSAGRTPRALNSTGLPFQRLPETGLRFHRPPPHCHQPDARHVLCCPLGCERDVRHLFADVPSIGDAKHGNVLASCPLRARPAGYGDSGRLAPTGIKVAFVPVGEATRPVPEER